MKLQERSAAPVERLELDLERIALSDVRKLFHADGTMKSPHEWDDDTAAAGSVEVREEFEGKELSGYLKKVKFHKLSPPDGGVNAPQSCYPLLVQFAPF